jgi:hypothetical protein
MSDSSGGGRAALSQRSAEIAVAALFILIGAVVIFDSVRLGWRWGEDGPQPGYFPFYVGVVICLASIVNLVAALVGKRDRGRTFVEVGALKLVLSVLVPAIAYVAIVSWTGIYVASTLFIAFFMRWLGKYAWWKVAAVSVGTSVFFFLVFETWFKVPLPKGPLESLLGLG